MSWSGFFMMLCAFSAGQAASLFAGPTMPFGPWPMIAPMLLAGGLLVALAFVVLPGVERTSGAGASGPESAASGPA